MFHLLKVVRSVTKGDFCESNYTKKIADRDLRGEFKTRQNNSTENIIQFIDKHNNIIKSIITLKTQRRCKLYINFYLQSFLVLPIIYVEKNILWFSSNQGRISSQFVTVTQILIIINHVY